MDVVLRCANYSFKMLNVLCFVLRMILRSNVIYKDISVHGRPFLPDLITGMQHDTDTSMILV